MPEVAGAKVVGPKVVVLGPTASGKSEVALAAARAVPGTEIVAIDAMQVYRGMDIGTAKPTPADRAAVPHHGLDLVEPTTDMAVPQFRAAVDAALVEIADRGRTALGVAGTGLYLTAVLDRLELPGTWPDVRAGLEAQLAADGDPGRLFARLTEADAAAAARIEPGNSRRIVRALEVTLGSGRAFSSFGPGVAAFPPIPTPQLGIRWPRALLGERVDARVDAMVAAGLLDEVRRVRAGGMGRTAGQALGYKELVDHLDGRVTFDDAVAAIKRRTRQFATRQERWFRRDPRVRWYDVDAAAADPLEPVRSAVIAALRA